MLRHFKKAAEQVNVLDTPTLVEKWLATWVSMLQLLNRTGNACKTQVLEVAFVAPFDPSVFSLSIFNYSIESTKMQQIIFQIYQIYFVSGT